MIDIKIEPRGDEIVAFVTISGEKAQFERDLGRFKLAVSHTDRSFMGDVEPKHWLVRHPRHYVKTLAELREAVREYDLQLRMRL